MKPNIYINVSENSGVGLYRQYLPALALRERGLANVIINDFTWGENRLFCNNHGYDCDFVVHGFDAVLMADEYVKHLKEVHKQEPSNELRNQFERSVVNMVEPSVETLAKIGAWADIIVVGRRDVPEYLSTWAGIRDFFNIPFVVDTDDNVGATRPFNPGYRGYHPGSEALLWNKKTMQTADAITVSTENLKNVHAKDNKNIYVLPNCVDIREWNHPKPKHEEIRIGCLLSSSHHEDALLLVDPLIAVLTKYPNAHFYYTNIFDYIFSPLKLKFPDQLHPIPWINLKTWPKQILEYSFDIGLAPLVDNFFNRAKSQLRYMEYSAAKMATVASPVEPYKIITPGKNGFLASNKDEWIKYISLLIEDSKTREKIQNNAYRFIAQEYDITKNAGKWLRAYNEIIKDFRRHKGKKKPTFHSNLTNFQISSIGNSKPQAV